MKIVFVGPFALSPKSTVSTRAVPLAQALARKGYDVSVIVPPWDNPADSGKKMVLDGVDVTNIRVPRPFPLLGHLMIVWRLLREVNKRQPEVVHVFKPKAHAGVVAMVVRLSQCWAGPKRLVVDTDDWEGKGGWNDVERYSAWQKAFFAFQERWILRHADAVTAASRELEQIVRQLRGERGRVHYLPNCLPRIPVDRNREAAASMRERFALGDRPVILLYTRFFEFQIERVVAIVAMVFKAVPEARLLVVGRGLFGEERRFEDLCGEQGIADRVAFAGWVSAEAVGDHLAAGDLAIYPLEDTLLNRTKCPMKLVELQGAGLPVVADRVGQAQEYVADGETGILVTPGDNNGFAREIINLLSQPDLRGRLGEDARRRTRALYVWAQWTGVVEEAYSCGA